MRREGRQRGMIRTFPILSSPYDPRPDSRKTPNEISAPPTAGLFAKAPSKPTNHSKFTGKCARPMCRDCHIMPACKSKAKAKGTHKVRSRSSATAALDYLDSDSSDNLDYEVYYT